MYHLPAFRFFTLGLAGNSIHTCDLYAYIACLSTLHSLICDVESNWPYAQRDQHNHRGIIPHSDIPSPLPPTWVASTFVTFYGVFI
ncbi:hypothetical protein B0J17DRAFT_217698 [Rhizoctonia solani]|nr:hypothetical protein B0J17DRAFT_217698 [Rhizoctonia solani]